MKYFSSDEIQRLLPWESLIDTLAPAVSDYAVGTIICHESSGNPLTSCSSPRTGINYRDRQQAHVEALCTLYPDVKIAIHGRTWAAARKICVSRAKQKIFPAETRHDIYDVIITVASIKEIIYNEPARLGCMLIGVSAYLPDMIEIGSRTLNGSLIYVDDPVGAPTEVGDII